MLITEIMAGAALGIVLHALHDAIKKAKDRSLTTRSILDRLEATIVRIAPLLVQIDKLSEEGDDSQSKIIDDLKHRLRDAVSLVEAYANLRRRNLLRKFRYIRKIRELEASLKWMVDVDVQLNQWADIKQLMAQMSKMNTKLDEIIRQPTNHPCHKKIHSISQNTNQNIVEAKDLSSEENDEGLRVESKLKNDFHLHLDLKKKELSVNFQLHWDIKKKKQRSGDLIHPER